MQLTDFGMRAKVGAQTRLGLKKRLMIHKSNLSLLAKRTSIDKAKFAWVLRIWSENGAGNEIRTRDPNLGKVVLYP